MMTTVAALPMPTWGRPGEVWRVHEDRDWWAVSDGECDDHYCRNEAVAGRYSGRGQKAWCADHIAEVGLWVEGDRVLYWRLVRDTGKEPG